MSWKNIVITGLLCVVASPALAAPALSSKLVGLNAAGNWFWEVSVTPDVAMFADFPPNGNGGSVAAEIGINASLRNLVSATQTAAQITNFPNLDPGNSPFAAPINGIQNGIVTNGNNAFAALGSNFFTTGGAKSALTITTQRPTTASPTTQLNYSGVYQACAGAGACATGGTNGLLAQAGQSFGNVNGSVSKGVLTGNTNLDGNVDVVDLGNLAGNYNQAGTFRWQDGDFSGDGLVDVVDLGDLAGSYNTADPSWTTPGVVVPAGSGSLSGGGVPEPSTMILFAMGGSLLAAFRRKRIG